jgi:hypothetical protein
MIEFILPAMLCNKRCQTNVQKLEAHALGSLGYHSKAKHILGLLKDSNQLENTNLRTSAISNYKRELLSDPQNPPNKEMLSLLITSYQTLHQEHNLYSYYTGINLLYIVQLAKFIYPEEKSFTTIDIQES